MSTPSRRSLFVLGAIALGLLFYFAGTTLWPTVFPILSVGFLLGVPLAMGFLMVRGVPARGRIAATFLAWVPVVVATGILWLADWEGTICIVLASPLILLGASVGGLIAHARREREGNAQLLAIVLLPLIVMPLERGAPHVDRIAERVTAIEIDAPPARVWDEIADVDTIRAQERGRALYTAIGFPAPLAATLDFPQEGGVRIARFERGIEFVETITEWEAERRLSFAITPRRTSPEPALDQHVAIGGPYFDVLDGRYELEPIGEGRTRLVLTSRHRVTTRLNFYAGWWADRVMRSVQHNLLAVLKARAERADVAPKDRIRAATIAVRERLSRLPRASDSREVGFSIVGDLSGLTDVYPDSIVILVRDGLLRAQRLDGPQVLDSVTASLASVHGGSWNTGTTSHALVLEWSGTEGEERSLGPMLRFTIPRSPSDTLEGRWVVFTNYLTVPKTADNPYGTAWTYVHAPKFEAAPRSP